MWASKHLLSISCIIWAMFLLQNAGYCEELSGRLLQYEIFSKKQKIGRLTTKETKQNNELKCDSVFNLNLKQVGVDYGLSGRSSAIYTGSDLSSFDHWLIEQEQQWHLSGQRMKSGLWLEASRVKNRQQREVDELISLTSSIVAGTVPYASMVMDIGRLFTETESEGEEEVPFSYYDTTDLELPAYLLSLGEWKGAKKVKVFSTNSMEREKVKAYYLGSKVITAGAEIYHCLGYELRSRGENSTLWLNWKEEFGPTLVEEYSEDGELSLRTQLVSVDH